jgi:hypothetical protein
MIETLETRWWAISDGSWLSQGAVMTAKVT